MAARQRPPRLSGGRSLCSNRATLLLCLGAASLPRLSAAGSQPQRAEVGQGCDFAVVDGGAFSHEEFERLYRGKQAVLLRNAIGDWPATRHWQTGDSFVAPRRDLRLPLRQREDVSAFGATRAPDSSVLLGDWWDGARRGEAQRIIFDTNISSGLLPAIRDNVGIPAALASLFREPVFSLAVAAGPDEAAVQGLALHRHDESWLALVTGSKQWFVQPATDSRHPPLAFKTVTLEAAVADGSLQRCHQGPGDIVYLPKGTWHGTFNMRLEGQLRGAPPPLHLAVGGLGDSTAAMRCAAQADLGCLQRLWDADPTGSGVLLQENNRGESAIHTALTPATLVWLISHGVDANHRASGDAQKPPLLYMSERGDIACMEALLLYGARLRETDAHGQNALHAATAAGQTAAATWLMDKGIDPNDPSANGLTAGHVAADHADVTMLRLLGSRGADLDARRKDGAGLVHFVAAGSPRFQAIDRPVAALDFLHSRGIPLFPKTRNGDGPVAVMKMAFGKHQKTSKQFKDMARWFARKHAELKEKHAAMKGGDVEAKAANHEEL